MTNFQGMVPLHEAALKGHKQVIQILLSINAPVNPRTSADDTPADLAKRNGHTDCERVLRKNFRILIKSVCIDSRFFYLFRELQ